MPKAPNSDDGLPRVHRGDVACDAATCRCTVLREAEIGNSVSNGIPILSRGEPGMSRTGRVGFTALAAACVVAGFGVAAFAQQTQYPEPAELPNPYRLVEGWPTLPKNMNGGKWGEVIRVNVAHDGNIWV